MRMVTVSNYIAPAAVAVTAITRSDVQDLIFAAHQATIAALNAAERVNIDADAIKRLYDAAIALNQAHNHNRDI